MSKTNHTELISVVVIGDMNPAIHRPEWYLREQLATKDAVEQSRKVEFLFVPPLAQFSLGDITIVCDPERWEAKSHDWKNADSVLALARNVFEKLAHTPIKAVGLNLERAALIPGEPGKRLAAKLEGLALGLPTGGIAAQLGHTSKIGNDITLNITVRTTSDGSLPVRVWANVHQDTQALSAGLAGLEQRCASARTAISAVISALEQQLGR